MDGVTYRSPNQTNFMEISNRDFAKLDTNKNEMCILGNFNINLYQNNKYIVSKSNTLVSNSVSNDTKQYQHF